MRKSVKIRAISIAIALCALCANPLSAKPTKAIERGMTKDEVTAIYGRPKTSSFDDTSETWQYVKTRGGFFGDDVLITVKFDKEGKVIGYDEKIKEPTPSASSSSTSSSSSSSSSIIGYGNRYSHCLSPEAFDILYNKIKRASFDSGKLDLIEVAALGGHFSCSQCAKLVSIFSFTDGKMKALKFVAPHITDPQNAADIYRQFTFGSDRDKAAEIVRGAGR